MLRSFLIVGYGMFIGFLGFLMVGCSQNITYHTCKAPENAIQAFRGKVETQHPQWKDELKLQVGLRDKGSYWLAWFRLPEGTLGGTAQGAVDKSTCKVFNVSHTQ